MAFNLEVIIQGNASPGPKKNRGDHLKRNARVFKIIIRLIALFPVLPGFFLQ